MTFREIGVQGVRRRSWAIFIYQEILLFPAEAFSVNACDDSIQLRADKITQCRSLVQCLCALFADDVGGFLDASRSKHGDAFVGT